MLSLSKAHTQQLSSYDSWHGDDALSTWSEDEGPPSRPIPAPPATRRPAGKTALITAVPTAACRRLPPRLSWKLSWCSTGMGAHVSSSSYLAPVRPLLVRPL